MLTDPQIAPWRQLWQEANADEAWVAHNRELDANRTKIRGEILDLLDGYLAAQIDTPEFRATFDGRTKTDWKVFKFKGLSGAMFLNKLVKHLGNETELATRLRSVLRLPEDEAAAQAQMNSFQAYLGGEIKCRSG